MSSKIIRYNFFISLLFVNIFVTSALFGQFYSMGNDPARVKWRYTETPDFKVIYPQEIDSIAFRYVWLLQNLKPHVMKSLSANPGKVDVILHPYTAMSNGMVGVAPRRVELITTPPFADDYTDSWEKHLTIHELRHVGQVSKFEKGIFKPLRWLAGEQAVAAGVGLYMSQWKLEGDAVVSETELTTAGRGRDPDHLLYYKTAFLNGDYRNWDRWTLGSFKHYVPDIYSFGYLFSSFVRYRAGNPDYMGELTDYVISRFYDINAQNKGYKLFTGLTRDQNFSELKKYYTERWAYEDSLRAPFTPVSPLIEGSDDSRHGFLAYSYPLLMDDKVYAVKRDFDNISRLVSVSEFGEEKFLRYMGNISSPPVINANKIYWTEYIGSARWDLEVFSDLFSYDLYTGESERLTKGERLFYPSFSNSGDKIVFSSYDIEGRTSVAVFSISKESRIGERDKIICAEPPGEYRIKEVVGGNGLKFYVILIKEGGPALFSMEERNVADQKLSVSDTLSGLPRYEWKFLFDMQGKSMSNLKLCEGNTSPDSGQSGSRLFFISDYDGAKNLYSYHMQDSSIAKVSNVRFGISGYDISDNGDVVLSDFSQSGYNLVSVSKDSLLHDREIINYIYEDEIVRHIAAEAEFNSDTLHVPKTFDYESKRYRKAANLFRVHSWAPLYYNIDNIKKLTYDNIYDIVSPGFIIYSQNSLSTAYTTAGYSWHEGFHSGHFKFSYHGFYPVIELKADINDRNRERMSIERNFFGIPSQTIDTVAGSPYLRAHLMAYLPLNYSRGGWNSGIIPSFIWRYTNDSYYSLQRGKFTNYQFVAFGLNAYKVLKTSHRDIFPKYGAGASLRFSAAPFSGENFGSLLSSSLYFYLPGFGTGQGLRVSGSFQKQFMNGKNYFMSNSISFPPGYQNRLSKWAAGADVEYALPLYTRDISLGSLLYIRRFQMIPFVSYYRNGVLSGAENLYSAGASVIIDLNLLGITYPLSLGLKSGYTGEDNFFMELLFKTPL